MPSETAWKARFTRLWNSSDRSSSTRNTLSRDRVLVALEAYRQLDLPGLPGPAALGRVAGVREDAASRILAALKADEGRAP